MKNKKLAGLNMSKILSPDELKKVVARLKSEGKKIVFTNGCFDLLHIGHIRYLKEARKLGDILIIGLNSDTSVRSLKPQRPINEEAHRAEVLASLETVDYVTLFSEDTPYELIKAVRPDVLVKGGDWKKEDIVGSDIVSEVHSLPYVAGVSTTGIIEKILNIKTAGLLLLTSCCLLLTSGIAFADAQKSTEALSKLLAGNKRFASGRHMQAKDLKQHPWAIVVACSDSMVAPEIIFDQGPGNIFVIRTAGNVLDPISVGSIEYAAKLLQTPLLIVLGHDKCDVVKAAVETREISQDNIMALVRKIVPAVRKATAIGGSKEDILHNAIRENVLIQKKYLLRKSPVVNNLFLSGAIQIVTCIYHDESGEVEIIKQ